MFLWFFFCLEKPSTSTVFVDTTSPIQQNGSSLPRTRELIRRKTSNTTTSTTVISGSHSVTRSSTTTETTSQIEIRRNQVQEDHNYGEPGPSTLRHSRRLTHITRQPAVLEVDPLELPETPQSMYRKHKQLCNTFMWFENEIKKKNYKIFRSS